MGARLAVDRRDLIGSGIARTSSYELPVSEAMWRVAAQSRLAVDVGANVGYFTALLSARARDVIAFEPHPAIAERLAATQQEIQRGSVGDSSSTIHDAVVECRPSSSWPVVAGYRLRHRRRVAIRSRPMAPAASPARTYSIGWRRIYAAMSN